MSLGAYLRDVRNERQFTLRDIEQLAKDGKIGAELSSGYLSMLEQDKVKEPSPRILLALSRIYQLDYIDLMKRVGYIPDNTEVREHTPSPVAFRGASQLKKAQRERIQRIINFELSETEKSE